MYPVVFTIPGIDFPISSFGLMLALAFLVGTWITSLRMREIGLEPELATTLLLWVMIGGIVGSKLYYAIDVSLREGRPFGSLLLARDGITFYGGLIAGVGIGALGCRVHGVPVIAFMNSCAVSIAVGQAIGRIGCFLVGDDYGLPSEVPWAVAFPIGAPPTFDRVHPTQLYEMAWLFAIAALLWRRRRSSPFLFGEYLVANGIGRFAIEHWRVNTPIALGLTEAQWIGLALVALGATGWLRARARAPAAAPA